MSYSHLENYLMFTTTKKNGLACASLLQSFIEQVHGPSLYKGFGIQSVTLSLTNTTPVVLSGDFNMDIIR